MFLHISCLLDMRGDFKIFPSLLQYASLFSSILALKSRFSQGGAKLFSPLLFIFPSLLWLPFLAFSPLDRVWLPY